MLVTLCVDTRDSPFIVRVSVHTIRTLSSLFESYRSRRYDREWTAKHTTVSDMTCSFSGYNSTVRRKLEKDSVKFPHRTR